MKKQHKIILAIITILLLIGIGYSTYYLNDYYHADESVSTYLNGTDTVSIMKTSNGLYLDGPGNDSALIFYPGAKIEYTAYLPLLMKLSDNGIDCFLVEMPFNLALLKEDSADTILSNKSYNYSNWYMCGHSLGGISASSYTSKHKDNINSLILLASYSIEKIEDIPVLSIYGSNDNVLNMKNYDENKVNLPDNFTEYIIIGGNHAQFASYGDQDGDGISNITGEEQINETIDVILNFTNPK